MEKKKNLVTVGFVAVIAIAVISFAVVLFTTNRNEMILSEIERLSNNVNKEALEHYKEVLKNTNVFSEDSEIKLAVMDKDGISYVYAYEISPGKDIGIYEISGELAEDMYTALNYGMPNYNNYVYSAEKVDNQIIANRTVIPKMLEEQEKGILPYVKHILEEAGYGYQQFSSKDDELMYGNYIIKGSAKDCIMEYLHGSDVHVPIDSCSYDITSKDNVITAEIVDN